MSSHLDDFLQFQKKYCLRWKLHARNNSPYIYIRDPSNSNERVSLKPLLKNDLNHCEQAWKYVQDLKDNHPNEKVEIIQTNNYWMQEKDSFAKFLALKNKGSTNKEYLSLWKNLNRNKIPSTSKGIHEWLKEKDYGSHSFKKRLDFLRQVQLFILKKEKAFPKWFTPDEYQTQRGMHNEYRKMSTSQLKRQEKYKPRAIVSREVMEKYLDKYLKDFPWQCWCLAMMMNYGLRNHELFWLKKEKNLFLLVPGRLTKAKEDHYVWPAFAYWDEKYNLFHDFEKYQTYIRSRCKPVITSATQVNMSYSYEDPGAYENGIAQNNDQLGEFISRNTLGVKHQSYRYHKMKDGKVKTYGKKGATHVMPKLSAKATNGTDEMIDALPYDLRHTWAVTMHTEPAFSHLTVDACAEAMGHSATVHRERYLVWIDKTKVANDLIDNWQHPHAA